MPSHPLRRSPPLAAWADPICHPLPLGAALLLAVNDHWLKGAGLLPGAVTGKLSDLCGLFFFPALLLAALRGALALVGRRTPPGAAAAVVLAVGALFAAANLDPGFNAWLGGWWVDKVMDPTDLVALLVLLPCWLWLTRGGERRARLGVAAVIACGLASAATSPPRFSYPRNFPAWTLLESVRVEGEPTLDLWVSKSGKEGMGLTLLVRSCGEEGVRIEILEAELRVGAERFVALELPPARSVRAGETERLYLGFAFDNERLWNEGRREGEVRVRLRVGSRTIALASRARHLQEGFHRRVPTRQAPACDESRVDRCTFREVPRPRAPATLPSTRPSGNDPVRP